MKSPISAVSSPLFVIMRMERGVSPLMKSPISSLLPSFCNNENGEGVFPLMKSPIYAVSSPLFVIMRMEIPSFCNNGNGERVSNLMKSPISALLSPFLFIMRAGRGAVRSFLFIYLFSTLSSSLSLSCGNEG
jgi:hypothetical protein